MKTKIRTGRAKIFPEGAIGYFLGPALAMLTNSIMANYFNAYLSNVLNINRWASWFFTWMPVISVFFSDIGQHSCRAAVGPDEAFSRESTAADSFEHTAEYHGTDGAFYPLTLCERDYAGKAVEVPCAAGHRIYPAVCGGMPDVFHSPQRVTEEIIGSDEAIREALSVREQAKICFKDRFWWIMMAFLLLYQMGGMLKNVSQLYFCQAMFPDVQGNYTTAYGGRIQGMLAIRAAMPWIFIGGETIGFGVIFVLFLFMKVEDYADEDRAALSARTT